MEESAFGTLSAVGDIADFEESDFRIGRDIWPDDILPREPEFPYGKQPIHEHVRIQAEERPDDPAVTFYGRTLTWSELDERVDAFARALAARGHGKGDVLAIYLQNCPQFVIAYHGAHRAGMITAPLNPLVKDIALEHLLTDSESSVLVTHTDLLDIYESIEDSAGVDDVFVTRYSEFADFEASPVTVHSMLEDEAPMPDERTAFSDVLTEGRSSDERLPEVDITDMALYQYTGGTSGMPKGCRHTHWNIFFKAVCGAQGAIAAPEVEHVSLAIMPIFHVAGKLGTVDRPPISGMHVVLLPRYTPEIMMQAIDAYGVTGTWFTVPMANQIMNHERVDEYDLTSLSKNSDVSICAAWGTTLTEEMSNRWEELTGAKLHTGGYGLSETHTGDTQTAGHSRIDAAFVGQPNYGVEVEIRDFETNQPLPPGEEGEIVLRTPSNMLGYLNRPDRTAEVIEPEGWLHTGDRGVMDEDGFLYFQGRQKDVIKVSGHTVAPREIQRALEQSELVEDSIVVGKPHDTRGHVVEAHVLPVDDSVTEEDILEWADEHLAEFKRPKSVIFRDSFPRTDIGKIDRVRYYEGLPEGYA